MSGKAKPKVRPKPLQVRVLNERRMKIMSALGMMPDEGFEWFVLACPPSAMMHGGRAQIWPDGIGGFTSQESIQAVRKAVDAYLTGE